MQGYETTRYVLKKSYQNGFYNCVDTTMRVKVPRMNSKEDLIFDVLKPTLWHQELNAYGDVEWTLSFAPVGFLIFTHLHNHNNFWIAEDDFLLYLVPVLFVLALGTTT